MDYLRIWADDEGCSHFEDVVLDREVVPAQPGVAELWQSAGIPVARLHVVDVRAADQRPDWHCAPRRQFVVFLDGWAEITTSDGTTRRVPAGGTVLAEDCHGQGHVTTHEPGDRRVLVIPLERQAASVSEAEAGLGPGAPHDAL
jgi:hypothetical protein